MLNSAQQIVNDVTVKICADYVFIFVFSVFLISLIKTFLRIVYFLLQLLYRVGKVTKPF